MKVISLVVLLVSASLCNLDAQNDSAFACGNMRVRHFVYGEAGGNAYVYSVNYALALPMEEGIPCLRVGVGYNPGYDKAVLVPVELTVLAGRSRHYFEMGAGVTYFSRLVTPHISPGGSHSGVEETKIRSTGVIVAGRIGYCFLPVRAKGVMLRAGYTPLLFPGSYYFDEDFANQKLLALWGGVSVGFAF
jgi:hypothetical protein